MQATPKHSQTPESAGFPIVINKCNGPRSLLTILEQGLSPDGFPGSRIPGCGDEVILPSTPVPLEILLSLSQLIAMGFRLTSALLGILALQPWMVVLALPAPEPVPSPPGIPSASVARKELDVLLVTAQGSQDGYDRDKFPHWISQGGSGNPAFLLWAVFDQLTCHVEAVIRAKSFFSAMEKTWSRAQAARPPVEHGIPPMMG